MNKVIISPSILSADFANLELEIKRLEESGADWIHIDVMDGHFVPNLTIGAPVVKAIKRITNLPLDVHLMIDNPEKYIKDFADAGSDILTFHYEATLEKTEMIIEKIKSFGIKAGLSIKPKTQLKEIEKYINLIDLLLIMTVEPGFGGQKFMKDSADKIKDIQRYLKNNIYLEVDGGINKETAEYCRNLGINVLVAGNYIFSADNMKQAISSMR